VTFRFGALCLNYFVGFPSVIAKTHKMEQWCIHLRLFWQLVKDLRLKWRNLWYSQSGRTYCELSSKLWDSRPRHLNPGIELPFTNDAEVLNPTCLLLWWMWEADLFTLRYFFVTKLECFFFSILLYLVLSCDIIANSCRVIIHIWAHDMYKHILVKSELLLLSQFALIRILFLIADQNNCASTVTTPASADR